MFGPRQGEPVDAPTGGARGGRRRRLVRISLGVVAVAILALVTALVAVHTASAKRRVLAEAKSWLAARQIDLQAVSLDYNLLTLSVTLNDVVVRATARPDLPPFARVAHANVDVSLTGLLRGRYFVEEAALVGSDLHFVIDEAGNDNVPQLAGEEPPPQEQQEDAGAAVDYLIERFALSDGRLRYEDRQRNIDAVVQIPSLTIDGDRATRQHRIQIATTQGQVRVDDRTVDIEQLAGELAVDRDSMQVQRLQLGAAGSNIALTGRVSQFADPLCDLTLDASLDVMRLAAFAGLEEPVGGIVKANVHASGPVAALAVRTRVQSDGLSFRTLEPIALLADATYDAAAGRGRLEQLNATGPTGEVRASGVVALEEHAGDSQLNLTVDALDLSRLAQALELDYSAASVAQGEVQARWPGLDVAAATGDGRLTFTPTRAQRGRGVVPLGGTLTASARGDAVNVIVEQLQGLGATVNGNVSLIERRQIGGALHTSAEDVASVVAQAESFLGRPQGSLLPAPITGPLGIDLTLGGTIDDPAVDADIDAPRTTAGTISGIALRARASYASDAVTLAEADVLWGDARAHASGRAELSGEQALDFNLTADQIPIDASLAALGQEQVPANGIVSLQAAVQGSASSPRGAVTLQAADLIAYGETLGALSLTAALEGRRAELSQLRLDKPQPDGAGTLTARGTYDLDLQRYTAEVTSRDIRLTNLALADGAPVRAGIEIAANGEGTLEDPTGRAVITLTSLQVGDDQFGDVIVNGDVAGRQANVHANIPNFKLTANAQVATPAPHTATVEMLLDNLDLASLPLHLDTPLSGSVQARVTASGDLDQPADATATATIDRLNVIWNEQPIETVGPATMRYADRQVAIDRLEVRARESLVSLQGTLPLDPEGPEGVINLDAKADLASLVAYVPQDAELQATGVLTLQGSVRGSMRRIDPTLSLVVDNGSVSTPALGQPLSNVGARVDVADGLLRLSDLQAEWGAARLSASGEAPFGWLPEDLPIELPRQTGPAQVHAAITNLDLATLPGAPEELTGTVAVTADAEAPRPELTALTGQLAFQDLQVGFGGLTLAQQDTSTIRLADADVRVERFSLDGTAGQVDLTGHLGLTGEQPLDAGLRANLDVAALSSMVEDTAATGRASLELSATGTATQPTLKGFAELTDGELSVEEPRIAAQAVNLRIDLEPQRVTLSRLDAGLNGGTLSGSGSVTVDGASFRNLDLRLTAADVALDVPLNLRSLSKADIQVTERPLASGDATEIVAGGQITIDEAGLTDDINVDAGIFQALTAPRSLDLTETRNPLLERVRFDLKVDTATPIVVDNNLARAELEVDVRVLGTPYETGLSGRLDLAEGSELILNERRYEVERGIITFIDERSIQPSLDLALKTTARNYDISIAATGTPDDTQTTLTSAPALAEPDIMALLITGRTLDEMQGEEGDVAKSQMMSYLGGRAGSSLGRGLQRATGLSTVRVEPNLIASEADPGARLTVGQDLTSDLSLVYSTDLVNSSDSIWIAEYDVSRQFTTRTIRQSDDTYRFDVRHDVRFGGRPEPGRLERQRQTVRSVTIEGQTILSEDDVRNRFKLKEGSQYDFFSVREGSRRISELYRDRDYLQARVRVDRAVQGEEVDITLHVDPGPQVLLAFDGDPVSGGMVKEAREIWARGVFDTQRADDVRAALRTELVDDRYLNPTIDYELGSPDETPRRVTFHVGRGVRFERITLQFEGAGGIEPDDLEGVIDEQKLGTQVFTDPGDVTELLQRFYRERGFLSAEVDRPRYEFDEASREARVVVPVREGYLFSVRDVAIEGNQVYDTASLLGEIPLVSGDPFFPATAEFSLARIRQLYWSMGYNDVRPSYELSVDRDTGILDTRFIIEEGPRSVVASIDVEGTERASEQLVREEMEIEEGAPLDLSALGRSRQNLYGTGAFALVDVTRDTAQPSVAPAGDDGEDPASERTPEGAPSTPATATPSDEAPASAQPAPALEGDQPVRVNVAVREVQPFQVRYGVLFDTERGLGGILDVSNHNSLGGARVVGLRSRYDSQLREARLYINQPSLRPRPVETIASTYYREERNPSTSQASAFNVDRLGVMIQQERRLRDDYVWSYGYRFERARTYEPGLGGPLPPFVNVSPLTSTITRETRDEPLDAAQGSFLSHAFSFSPRFLGSDVRYIKYFGQYFHYIPLKPPTRRRFTNEIIRPRTVYAVGVRVGLANGMGGQDVPLSERFLAGGSTTLRGFEQNTVGPVGADGVPLGGEAMFVINNELRFPLIGILDGVVFADVGNVFQSVSDFTLTDLRESGGVGLRVRTPWLLVRLDYGVPFDRRPGESKSRFFFSIGQAF